MRPSLVARNLVPFQVLAGLILPLLVLLFAHDRMPFGSKTLTMLSLAPFALGLYAYRADRVWVDATCGILVFPPLVAIWRILGLSELQLDGIPGLQAVRVLSSTIGLMAVVQVGLIGVDRLGRKDAA